MSLVLLLLTGCQGAITLPVVEDVPDFKPVKADVEQRVIAFSGGMFDIPRGDLYVVYPYWHWSVPNVNLGLFVCNSTLKYRLTRSAGYWNEDDNIFGQWPEETGVHVERALGHLGYQVKQHRRSFFADKVNKPQAELLLSLKVTDMKMNMCYVHAPLGIVSMGRSGGEGVVTAEWEIYDTIREKVFRNCWK